MSQFKRFIFTKTRFFYIRNTALRVNPLLFNSVFLTYSGKFKLQRSVFFIHNKSKLSNLFLTKKIKPKPILKKK